MADEQAESHADGANPPWRSSEVPRILMLEDSPGEAELFRLALGFAWKARHSNSKLARPNIRVECTAQDALKSLREGCDPHQHSVPDLIVLDLDLPSGNSLVFLRALRQDARFAKLPVIIMAWSDEPSIIPALYELGIVGYIIKPMHFPDLVTIVGDICRQIFPEVPPQELCAFHRKRDE